MVQRAEGPFDYYQDIHNGVNGDTIRSDAEDPGLNADTIAALWGELEGDAQRVAGESVADIGTGYGVLAVGLALAGVATAAVGTDVDALALWLAAGNARTHGIPLAVTCSADPLAVAPTPLTVCNVPTHVDVARTDQLMGGLVARARHGRLLAVVHTSLDERYRGRLQAAGLHVRHHHGPTHTVLDATA